MLAKLVFLVGLQMVLSKAADILLYDIDDYEGVGHHFEKFMKDYNRQYTGDLKFKKFNVFIETLKQINAMNSKNSSATFGINEFADMTHEEYRSLLGFVPGVGADECPTQVVTGLKSSPAAWDWRDQNAVSPVKNQQSCGSCWAFSATALVESKIMQKGQTLSLSEQQLLDCDQKSDGCNGGQMSYALSLLMAQGGQESEQDYPYTSAQGSCSFDQSRVVAKVASCATHAVSDEATLQDLLYNDGPLAIAVYAGDEWQRYTGGILVDCENNGLNHGVLLVGYGSENNQDFWVIKNSWGASWGEQGFIRIRKGVGCCGVANSSPLATVSATVA